MRALKELYLKPYNAYMLRDDSLLFECNTIHPYIKYLFNGKGRRGARNSG